MEIKVKGEGLTLSSETQPVSTAHDYFYIIFNFRLKWTGTLVEASLIFFRQVPVTEPRYYILYIAELKDGHLEVSFTAF